MQYSYEFFTNAAKTAIECAIKSACMMGHTYVGCEHILLGVAGTEQSVGAKILKTRGVTTRDIIGVIEDVIGCGNPTVLSYNDFTPRANTAIESAIKYMQQKGCACVGTDHLLLSIITGTDNFAKKLLKEFDVNLLSLSAELEEYRTHTLSENTQKTSNMPKAHKITLLEKYGKNLTVAAQNGEIDPLVGRKAELDKMIRVLCRRYKNNPCLVGEPGVGKTAIAVGLARLIAEGDVPDLLLGKQIISIDLTALVAGTKYRGDFEDRVQNLINEASQNPDVILFIDELHTVVGAGSAEGSVDAANMLKPALTRGNFKVIGATTYSEYRKSIEKDSALERRFQPIYINEPTCEEAVDIIKGIRDIYSRHHGVLIPDEVIEATVMLSHRYINDRFLPDKAIDTLDEAAAKLRLERKKTENCFTNKSLDLRGINAKYTQKEYSSYCTATAVQQSNMTALSVEDIKTVIAENCNLPISRLGNDLLYDDPQKRLNNKIVGQDEAIDTVCKALRRSVAGIKDKRRPIGSFLFCGPTGVGKTYLCRSIAVELFGSEKNLIKLDMSEYSEKHTVSRLIGAPPGYVGYDEPGQLTEPVRKKPYSVVLFDEIEKAHPDVYNILLQILEDGVLTDSSGRKVSFANTVVVMTSNTGSQQSGIMGFNSTPKDKLKKEITNGFRPELLGRIDEVVIFNSLDRNKLSRICELLLFELKNIVTENGGNLEIDKSVFDLLARSCDEVSGGARGIRKLIRDKIEDKLSELAISCRGMAGRQFVCGTKDDEIIINVK